MVESKKMQNLITYIPNFIDNSNEIFKKLREELEWERKALNRSEYYCNDFPKPYIYGTREGLREYTPKPYHDEILNIRKKLEILTGTIFETCFLNRYLDQKDWLGWHADDSPEMDPNRPICIISLGVARKIRFKNNFNSETFDLLLEHGSLCIMPKGFQQLYKHSIPKAGFITDKMLGAEWHFGERISLTYRGFLLNEI